MYIGIIEFTIKHTNGENIIFENLAYRLESKTITKLKSGLCACVGLLEMLNAENIECNIIYNPRKWGTQ